MEKKISLHSFFERRITAYSEQSIGEKWRKECHGGTTTLRMIPDPDFLSYKFYQVRFGKFHNFGRTAILFASYFHLQPNDTFIIIIAEIILVMYAL